MAVLPDIERRALWSVWMRDNDEPISIEKADLRAAVDALDAWLDANASTVNAAIPQPARNQLSSRQKARLLSSVIARRFLQE